MSRDIFQLTEKQLRGLTGFLAEETFESSNTCIPLKPDEHANLVHPNESVWRNIYRDQYDSQSLAAGIRPRCVVRPSEKEAERLTEEYEKLWGS